MNSPISAELVRRCQERRLCTLTVRAAGALGAAIDAGLVSLERVLDMVHSCSSSDELGSMMLMLAATSSIEPAYKETQMLSQQSESTYTTLRPGIDYEAFSRYLELVQHQADTGTPLALSPAAIMQLEDQGAIVDLETGAIAWPGGGAA